MSHLTHRARPAAVPVIALALLTCMSPAAFASAGTADPGAAGAPLSGDVSSMRAFGEVTPATDSDGAAAEGGETVQDESAQDQNGSLYDCIAPEFFEPDALISDTDYVPLDPGTYGRGFIFDSNVDGTKDAELYIFTTQPSDDADITDGYAIADTDYDGFYDTEYFVTADPFESQCGTTYEPVEGDDPGPVEDGIDTGGGTVPGDDGGTIGTPVGNNGGGVVSDGSQTGGSSGGSTPEGTSPTPDEPEVTGDCIPASALLDSNQDFIDGGTRKGADGSSYDYNLYDTNGDGSSDLEVQYWRFNAAGDLLGQRYIADIDFNGTADRAFDEETGKCTVLTGAKTGTNAVPAGHTG